MKERIRVLKDRNLEMLNVLKEKEWSSKKLIKELSDSNRNSKIRIIGTPEEEKEKGEESFFKEVIAENFPNLRKKLNIQINEVYRTPNYLSARRASSRYTILKLKSQW